MHSIITAMLLALVPWRPMLPILAFFGLFLSLESAAQGNWQCLP